MASYQRLLNPVYNHLDNGNPTKALKECDQILRKQSKKSALPMSDPIWQNTNSLKAIALQRLNRIEEALELANRVRATNPSDETTLQMVSNVYRDCHEPQFIPLLYENALKTHESEDLYTHTFMAYLRNENFQQMKLIGGKLFQKYKQYPYLYWSAMAGYLQAMLSNPAMKVMNLTLARRFIEKELDKVDNERQIKLYLMILEELGDFKEIENVLDKHEKLFTQTLFGYKERLIRLWTANSEYGKIVAEAVRSIEADDNDWGAWKQLVAAVFDMIDHNSASSDASIKSVDELIAFVTDKCASCRSRAPHLAKFEVVARLRGVPEHWGSLEHLFINYCQMFCSKSSTFHDVQKYFDLLRDKDDLKRQIVEQLLAAADGVPDSLADTNLEAVCASHLLPYQLSLSWLPKSKCDIAKVLDFATLLIDKSSTLERVKNLMPTEPRPWDLHFLLAAQMALVQRPDTRGIARALQVLQSGIRHTGQNSDLTLMALNLYSTLGCGSKVLECAKTLDIKSVQFDSVGYVIFPVLARLLPEESTELMQNAWNFYLHANKDTTDMIIKCYQNGNFDQILDMMKFRDAILTSGMRRLTMTEYQISALLNGNALPLQLYTSNSTDNRDLEALNIFYEDSSQRIDTKKRQSFDIALRWVEFREVELSVSHQLIGEDVMLNRSLVTENLTKMREMIPAIGGELVADVLDMTIGISSGALRPPVAVLELKFATLDAAFSLKKTFVAEKDSCAAELERLRTKITNVVNQEAPCVLDHIVARAFVVESVMALAQIMKSVAGKIKALRRKNQSKLQKSVKQAFEGVQATWETLKTLEDQFTNPVSSIEVENLSLCEDEKTEEIEKQVAEERQTTYANQNEAFRKNLIQLENALMKK